MLNALWSLAIICYVAVILAAALTAIAIVLGGTLRVIEKVLHLL